MTSKRWMAAFVVLAAPGVWGQHSIRLKIGTVDTSGRTEPAEWRSLRERHHWILQFRSYPGAGVRAELDRRGIRVLAYVPDDALMVSAQGPMDLHGLEVVWAGGLAAAQKISPMLAGGEYDLFVVSLHKDADLSLSRDAVRRAGFEVLEGDGLLPNHMLVSGAPDRLGTVAAMDDVAYIFPGGWDLRFHRPRIRCPGPITEPGPVAEYALEGPGWPKDSGGNFALQYFFDTFTAKVDANVVRTEIERALTEWERYGNVSFAPAQKESSSRSVDILFASGDHGDAYPFTSSSIVAHTFFPSPPNAESIAGDVHFNNDVAWRVGSGIDVFSVALHEIGHALGLAHSDNPNAVMYPYYRTASGLSSDDIAAVQALYGSRGVTAPIPTPTPTSTPTSPSGLTPASPPPPPAPSGNPTSSGSDTVPPSLTVLSPGGSIVSVYASPMVISGTASDNVAVTEVDWSNSAGGSGKAAGTTSWSATVPLLVGDNVITVKAYDGAGNASWRAVTVVRH